MTLQNNLLLPFRQVSQDAGISTDTRVNDQVNFTYRINLIQSHSAAVTIRALQQQATLNFIPSARLQFKLSGEQYNTYGQPIAFFADASARYHLKKLNTDIELAASNFLNVKSYNAVYLTANTLTASSYTLPGRIILIKVLFNL
jgi:hypothetical protein